MREDQVATAYIGSFGYFFHDKARAESVEAKKCDALLSFILVR